MLFYVFETQTKNIYKFGTTKHNLSIKRLQSYNGLNIPKRVITVYTVNNGYHEEKKFKTFLKDLNIDIVCGNEFFEYQHNIDKLVANFKCDGSFEVEQSEHKQNDHTVSCSDNRSDRDSNTIGSDNDSDIDTMKDIERLILNKIKCGEDIYTLSGIHIIQLISDEQPKMCVCCNNEKKVKDFYKGRRICKKCFSIKTNQTCTNNTK